MDSQSLNYESELTLTGFMTLFEDLLKSPNWEGNYFRAYIEAEEIHFKQFKKTRYKSYDSFRQARRHYITITIKG